MSLLTHLKGSLMPSASRSSKRVAAIAILAVGALLAPRPLTAQEERVDSIVESAHNGAQLGSKTIRVLLGHTADAQALSGDAFGSVTWGGRRYRGTLQFVPDGGSYAVINHVDLEEYLRGVLPGELGSRDPRDRAALQAQAVAARSYAAARMGEARRLYDVTATVSDQVYGGMSVERPESDAAVRDTRGLVLTWGDRIISAPYHSHGGMLTAGADEVWWKRGGEPFLRPVDDHSPDGGCFCDAGGTKGWERRFAVSALGQLLAEYGRSAGVATSGDVVGVQVSARGASGRVTALEVTCSCVATTSAWSCARPAPFCPAPAFRLSAWAIRSWCAESAMGTASGCHNGAPSVGHGLDRMPGRFWRRTIRALGSRRCCSAVK
jgi:SpoIID/LytB domain protein